MGNRGRSYKLRARKASMFVLDKNKLCFKTEKKPGEWRSCRI